MEVDEKLSEIINSYKNENIFSTIMIGSLYFIHPLVALHSYIKVDLNLMCNFIYTCVGKNEKIAFFYKPGKKIVELSCGLDLLDCKQV